MHGQFSPAPVGGRLAVVVNADVNIHVQGFV